MLAVTITPDAAFMPGKPILLFEKPYQRNTQGRWSNYDVAPDGQRFVMIEAQEGSTTEQFHVVLNWTEELKRLVPTDN